MPSVAWSSFLRLSEFIFRKIKMYKKESLNSENKSQQNIKKVFMSGTKLLASSFVQILGESFFDSSGPSISSVKKRGKRQSSPSFVLWMYSSVDFSEKSSRQIYLSAVQRSDDGLRSMLVISRKSQEIRAENSQNQCRRFLHQVLF